MRTIPSNFGNAQAVSNSIFTIRSIKKQKLSIQFHFFCAKYLGTLARKAKVSPSPKFGK